MVHDVELFESEIQLAEDECCIVFDFACLFPYANPEDLVFEFSLGMETFDDIKINHRYPNKNWQTISKKYGRRVSKIGYPVVMKLDQQMFLLCLKVGIQDEVITLVFPVVTNMTKEKPVCGLSLHFNFDQGHFVFTSFEKADDFGWFDHRWHNWVPEGVELREHDVVLNPPCLSGENCRHVFYDNLIEPFPSALCDLLV